MARLAIAAAAAAVVMGSLPARAAAPCAAPVRPGRSIGQVALGAKLAELAAAGVTVRALEGRQFLASADGVELRVEVDRKQQVTRIRVEGAQVCIDEGRHHFVELAAKGADMVAPLPGCGLFAAQHRSSWQCPERGVEFFREGKKTGASVFAPSDMKPFKTAPPSVPVPPAPVVKCEPVAPAGGTPAEESAEERCFEEPPPDPCQGNIARMPEIACGFFGRDERLALECYLVDLCMGTFAESTAGRIQLYTADGWLGSLAPSRQGRGMRHPFAAPPPVGTKLRVIVDAEVAALPPVSSLPNPAVARSEVMEQMKSGKPAPIRVRHLVGGRSVPGGFVLDLEVPRSAYRTPPGQAGVE